MLDVVEQLDKAIDALSTLDPDALTDAELDEAVIELQRQRNRLGAVAARLLGRWDRRRVWAEDQSRSAATRWCATPAARSPPPASNSAGRASCSRCRPPQPPSPPVSCRWIMWICWPERISRGVTRVFADHEATLVAECTICEFPQAKRMIDYWCQRCRRRDRRVRRATRQRRAAHLSASPTLDGTVVVNGVLDPVGGTIVVNELVPPGTRSVSRRRASRHRAHRRPAAGGGAGRDGRRARRPSRRRGNDPGRCSPCWSGTTSFTRMCELANGQVITPGTLVPWLGTAELETVLFDGPTTVISVSKRRRFTGALRRAIQVRDRHCQHPSRV